jgi:phytoene dehydrogenase-like protein
MRDLYKNVNIKEKYQCIIVGGGMGGLTMAGMLALYGIEVLLVEKNPNLGGYITDYNLGEYVFSHSIDWMSGLHEKGKFRTWLQKLNLLDKVEFFHLEKFKRVITPDYNVSFSSDFEEFEETMISIFPKEESGIKNFVNLIRSFGGSEWITYFRPFKNFEYLPFLQSFFTDKALIAILSANVNDNIPAYLYVLFLYRCLSKEAYLLKDITLSQFMDLIGIRLLELGTVISTNTEVSGITMENNLVTGVKLLDGRFIKADAVITDIDLITVYNKYLPMGAVNNYFLNKLNSRDKSYSLISIFLGVNKKFDHCEITGEPTVYLPTHEVEDLYADDPKLWHLKMNIRSTWQPFLAPEGKAVVDIRALVKKNLFSKWMEDGSYRSDPEYLELKSSITEALIKNSEIVLGDYIKNIEEKRVATPLTLKRYTNNSCGSGMGWEVNSLEYLNGFRIVSPISNLFHVGAWASFPGVEGVINYGLSILPRIVKFYK